MDSSALVSLTNRQRDCLRLASPGCKSEEIAARLGLSVGTVETHIKAARAKLGGISRYVAGEQLRHFEATQSLGSQPLGMAETQPFDTQERPERIAGSDEATTMAREYRAVFDMGGTADFGMMPPVTQPPRDEERRRNDLTVLQRIALMAAVATLIVILLIAVRPLADGFSTLANFVLSTKHP